MAIWFWLLEAVVHWTDPELNPGDAYTEMGPAILVGG